MSSSAGIGTAVVLVAFLLGLVVFVALVLVGVFLLRKRIGGAWKEIGEANGLVFKRSTRIHGYQRPMRDVIAGHIDGIEVEAFSSAVIKAGADSGGARATFTFVRAILPKPLDMGLRAASGTAFEGLAGRRPEGEKFDFEKSSFHVAFDPSARDVQAAKSLLREDLRVELARLNGVYRGVGLSDGLVQLKIKGICTDPATIRTALHDSVGVARMVSAGLEP